MMSRVTAVRHVLLPWILLHELCHVVAAAPWASDWQVTIASEGAAAHVEWREDAPGWGMALAFLAPMLSGATIALATGVALSSGVTPEPSPLSLLTWTAWGLGLIALTWPSKGDIEGAKAAVGGDES